MGHGKLTCAFAWIGEDKLVREDSFATSEQKCASIVFSARIETFRIHLHVSQRPVAMLAVVYPFHFCKRLLTDLHSISNVLAIKR